VDGGHSRLRIHSHLSQGKEKKERWPEMDSYGAAVENALPTVGHIKESNLPTVYRHSHKRNCKLKMKEENIFLIMHLFLLYVFLFLL
jgi:hypothetical protein